MRLNDSIPHLSSLPAVEGKATIELRSDGGALHRRIEQHNDVSERFLDGYARLTNYLLLYPSGSLDGVLSPSRRLPTSGLLLTDADHPFNDEVYVAGRFCANGAAYNATPSGSVLASFNSGESVRTPTYLKFVYDFATNQANSTFQSIYTIPSKLEGSEIRCAPISGQSQGNVDTSDLILRIDSSALAAFRDSSLYIWDQIDFFNRAVPVQDLLIGTPYTLSPAVGSGNPVCIYNGEVYWVSGSGSSMALYRQPISASGLGGSPTKIMDLNNAWQTASFGRTGTSLSMDFSIAHDGFIMILTGATPGSIAFVLLDKNSFSVKDSWIVESNWVQGAGGRASLSADPNGDTYSVRRFGYSVSTSTSGSHVFELIPGGEYAKRSVVIGSGTQAIAPVSAVSDTLSYGGLSDGSNPNARALSVLPMFFSRAVLPAPITKLPTQTMKITYEFEMANPFT